MVLNLVYGRSGTGKSKIIYENLKSKIGTGCIYLIVPEQSNLMAEKRLFEVTRKKYFNRYRSFNS